MAFNCCSNCLPLLLEYHSASLDLERKIQMQKIELSKLQFEKQIRDLASLSISQVTAPETPNSKLSSFSLVESSLTHLKPDLQLSPPINSNQALPAGIKLDLVPEKEKVLMGSLNELKSSLSSLMSSTDYLKSSLSDLKRSSEWGYTESDNKEESLFTFQEGHNRFFAEPEQERKSLDSKKSSLMSPLRESDLKNSKETSSGLKLKDIEKPTETLLSEILDSSGKPSSSFNKAFLTLEELQHSSGRRRLFDKSD